MGEHLYELLRMAAKHFEDGDELVCNALNEIVEAYDHGEDHFVRYLTNAGSYSSWDPQESEDDV